MKIKSTWVRGGLIGIATGIFLFFFYLFAYYPILDSIYEDRVAVGGGTPNWTETLPKLTGHFYLFMAPFLIPYGHGCDFTEPVCTNWSSTSPPPPAQCVAWTMEGTAGCCITVVKQPTAECADRAVSRGMSGIAAGLGAVYFAVGAAIALLTEKRKRKAKV